MFVALVCLGLVLTAVALRELLVSSEKRKLPNRGAAIVIALLGLGSCVGGGMLGAGNEPASSVGAEGNHAFDCELPAGITPGSHAANTYCDLNSQAASASARAELAEASSAEALSAAWAGVPAVDLDDCSKLGDRDMMCVNSQASFIERWPLAWKREFTSMTEAIYCFDTGCSGAVIKNPVEACAWSLAVVDSGSAYVGPGDRDTMKRICSALTSADQDKAEAIAKRIIG